MPIYLLLPLAAAFLYALGSVYLKRSLKEGAAIEQGFHLTNFAIAVVFAPLLFLEKQEVAWESLWQPVVTGFAFYTGSWLTFVSIRRGDISLVTPLLGTKVVFVALGMTVIAGKFPPTSLWIASILTALGILLMGAKDLHAREPGFAPAALAALSSAAIFGICDVFVRMWAEDFGPMTFLPVSSIVIGILSACARPLQKIRQPLMPPAPAGRFVMAGAVIIGIQAIFMGLALSYIDDATGINVVYSSRGLWAIVLIGLIGHHFGNHERHTAGAAFWWRTAGTILLTIAIVIAVIARVE